MYRQNLYQSTSVKRRSKKGVPGHDNNQHIGVSGGVGSTQIHAVVDGLYYPLVLELTSGQVNDVIMLKNVLNSLIYPEVPFWLIKLMVHVKIGNILPTKTQIYAFSQSRIRSICSIAIFHIIKKDILLYVF